MKKGANIDNIAVFEHIGQNISQIRGWQYYICFPKDKKVKELGSFMKTSNSLFEIDKNQKEYLEKNYKVEYFDFYKRNTAGYLYEKEELEAQDVTYEENKVSDDEPKKDNYEFEIIISCFNETEVTYYMKERDIKLIFGFDYLDDTDFLVEVPSSIASIILCNNTKNKIKYLVADHRLNQDDFGFDIPDKRKVLLFE